MKHHSTRSPLPYLIIINILILSAVVFGFEYLLRTRFPSNIKAQNHIRHIRLKEYPPSSLYHLTPDDLNMSFSEGLLKKEFRMEIDARGYISPSSPHEKPDKRIIFLGGSTTACKFVEEGNRFPFLTGRLLETNKRKINSINSGVGGNHSLHSINIYLNKAMGNPPDIAVLMHNFNDLVVLLHHGTYWNSNDYRSLLISEKRYRLPSPWELLKTVLPNLCHRLAQLKRNFFPRTIDEFSESRGTVKTVHGKHIIDQFTANLNIFIAVAKAGGATPVLMTQANRLTEPSPLLEKVAPYMAKGFGLPVDAFIELYKEMNRVIRDTARQNDVLLIDLAERITPTEEYFSDIIHFNDKGSRLAAGIIAEKIGPLLDL